MSILGSLDRVHHRMLVSLYSKSRCPYDGHPVSLHCVQRFSYLRLRDLYESDCCCDRGGHHPGGTWTYTENPRTSDRVGWVVVFVMSTCDGLMDSCLHSSYVGYDVYPVYDTRILGPVIPSRPG